jgi:hypothetical protein
VAHGNDYPIGYDDWGRRDFGGGPRLRLGKVTQSGGISAGSSGSVQPYGGDTKGEEEATGDEVQAYARFGDVDEDSWVLYARVGSGWEIVQAECAG